jgi:flagellar assembly protein FliH
MSARARLAPVQSIVLPYAWQPAGGAPVVPVPIAASAPAVAAAEPAVPSEAQLASIEREAFASGFAQGERAGAETAAVQADAMLRRLTHTIEEVATLRTRIARDTEQQMVQLALTVARRILQREVSVDRELVMAIARVALDRVADAAKVTLRLNAEDHAAIAAAHHEGWPGGHVTVIADARLPRGGCRLESDLGNIDAGLDAQLHEMTQALLQEAPVAVNVDRR